MNAAKSTVRGAYTFRTTAPQFAALGVFAEVSRRHLPGKIDEFLALSRALMHRVGAA